MAQRSRAAGHLHLVSYGATGGRRWVLTRTTADWLLDTAWGVTAIPRALWAAPGGAAARTSNEQTFPM